jgi:hypothetical protein
VSSPAKIYTTELPLTLLLALLLEHCASYVVTNVNFLPARATCGQSRPICQATEASASGTNVHIFYLGL